MIVALVLVAMGANSWYAMIKKPRFLESWILHAAPWVAFTQLGGTVVGEERAFMLALVAFMAMAPACRDALYRFQEKKGPQEP